MEIIIHGKPNSVDHKSTNGIDPFLVDKIEEVFFRNMSLYEEKGSMYVDVWNWKDNWYGVYTYLLYSGVRDTAGRQSYFALSLIIPDQYCCLVSEVYNLLKKVTSSIIIGGFIDKTGKYILDTFQNDSLFNSVVNEVATNYINLAENFDNEFKPQSEFTSNLTYNLKDCDSKAFVDALKQYGRIIVSESAPTKDSLLAGNKQARQELSRVKSVIQEKDETIVQLNEQLKELSGRMSSSGKKKDDEIKRLQKDIDKLEGGKQSLLEERGKILEGWKEVEDALTRFPLVGTKNSTQPVEPKKKGVIESYLPFIPFANSVLIVILTLVCLAHFKNVNDVSSQNKLAVLDKTEKYFDKNDSSNPLFDMYQQKMMSYSEELHFLFLQSTGGTEICHPKIYNTKGKSVFSNDTISIGDTLFFCVDYKPYHNFMHNNPQCQLLDSIVDGQTIKYQIKTLRKQLVLDYRPSKAARKNSPNAIEYSFN